MKAVIILFLISSYSFAGVMPLRAQQNLEEADAGLDLVLTDAQGMSLYVFTRDKDNLSNCTGNCLKVWPPALLSLEEVEKVKEGSTTFGVLIRDDGQKQLTLDQKPLYYYIGDEKAGDRTGQGVGGVWFLLKSHFTVKQGAKE